MVKITAFTVLTALTATDGGERVSGTETITHTHTHGPGTARKRAVAGVRAVDTSKNQLEFISYLQNARV